MFIDFRDSKESGGHTHRDRQRDINQLPPIRALTGDQICNLSVYGMMLQPTEPLGQGKLLLALSIPVPAPDSTQATGTCPLEGEVNGQGQQVPFLLKCKTYWPP